MNSETTCDTAEEDHSFGHAARRRAVDILIEAKVDYTAVLYSGIEHGFATRADTTVPKQSECFLQTCVGVSEKADRIYDIRAGQGTRCADCTRMVQPSRNCSV